MNVDITGQNIDVTDALRQRIEKSLEKIKMQDAFNIHRIHVVLEVEKNEYHCDMQVYADNENYVVKSKNSDMYTAIDKAADKMDKQMKTTKSRLISGRKH